MESPASSSSGGGEKMCRVCNIPLVPPDAGKYRTIRCEKCKEVTPVGPAPEDKKYVICSCNALLIVDDDATIFTCTRCKKMRMAVEVAAKGGTTRNAPNSGAYSPNLFQSYNSGTVRKNIYRTVSTKQAPLENIASAHEASGTVTPNTRSPAIGSPNLSDISSDGAEDFENLEIRMNDDQVYLANFFARRVRPSVIQDLDSGKIWLMRLKVLLWVIYNLVVSALILSNVLEHQFRQQFGFSTLATWKALILFVPYIASFCIEWVFNKIIIFGYVLMCLWFCVFACKDEDKRAFFWNFYDTGHLLDEVMFRAFYLRIPRLQVPIYRFFNPPINSQIETEFFFLNDVHLITLVFQHPKINFFFKFWLGYAIVVKTLGRAGCILAIIILPFNAYTIFYAAETFISLIWMVIWWLVTNKRE
eukprot:Phypoly_transcript_09484.p1 GENE.Phypoly_transcript_09484~~Phypoly_transcript_09484.p1  ORF type:complete len:417 (+),score=43.35 Phypoly_transcript_09484:112-1362(+)